MRYRDELYDGARTSSLHAWHLRAEGRKRRRQKLRRRWRWQQYAWTGEIERQHFCWCFSAMRTRLAIAHEIFPKREGSRNRPVCSVGSRYTYLRGGVVNMSVMCVSTRLRCPMPPRRASPGTQRIAVHSHETPIVSFLLSFCASQWSQIRDWLTCVSCAANQGRLSHARTRAGRARLSVTRLLYFKIYK